MGKIVLRGGLKVKGSLASGAGDDLLTRDATTADVGIIDGSITTLPENQIFVGNISSVPTAVAVTGDIGITSDGVTSISAGVIVNADVNASAGIALTKLAATTASRALVSDASGFITESSVTSTEVDYLSGVTSSIQTQLNSKQATITGGATTILSSNLTASRALTSSTTGKVEVSSVTSTELGYVSGVTSSLQTQLDSKLTVNLTSPVDGSILYNVSGEWVNLNPGSNGQVLTLAAGIPSWASGTSNGIPGGGTASQYLIKNSSTDYDAGWDTLTIGDVSDVTSSADDINLLQGLYGTITGTELSYLAGVTSPIQTQLDNKMSNSLSYNYILIGGPSGTATQLAPGSNGTLLTIVGGIPTWQTFSASGDVVGPVSSTDNAIVRWNGVPGDSIQDSGVIIDDSNNITGVASISSQLLTNSILVSGTLNIQGGNGEGVEDDGSDVSITSGSGRTSAISGHSGSVIITTGTPTGSGIRGTILSGYYHGFTASSLRAAIGIGSLAGDPSSLGNGDMWYNSSSNELKARINGASVALGSGGISGLTINRIPYATSATTLGDDSGLTYDATNDALTVGNIRLLTRGGTSYFIGFNSGNTTTTASSNIALGGQAMVSLTSGNSNIGIGSAALDAVTSGTGNIWLGQDNSTGITTGSRNIVIGTHISAAVDVITTGSSNVLIGDELRGQDPTATGQLSIQNIIFGTGNTETGTTISTGGIGIGVADPTSKLDIAASTTSRASLRIHSGVAPTTPNEGDIWSDGTNLYMYISGVTKTFTLV